MNNKIFTLTFDIYTNFFKKHSLALALTLWVIIFWADAYLPQIGKLLLGVYFTVLVVSLFSAIMLSRKILLNTNKKNIIVWMYLGAISLFLCELYWYTNELPANIMPAFRSMKVFILINTCFFITWGALHGIFALQIIRNYIIKNSKKLKIFILIALIDLIIITSYIYGTLSSIHALKNSPILNFTIANSLFSFPVRVFLFDTSLIVLFYANKKGVILYFLGVLILCSNYTIVTYVGILNPHLNTTIFANNFWILGVIIYCFGLITITLEKDFNLDNWFRNDSSIRSAIVTASTSVYAIMFILFYLILYFYPKITFIANFILPIIFLISLPFMSYLFVKMSQSLENAVNTIIHNITGLTDINIDNAISQNSKIDEFTNLQILITQRFKYDQFRIRSEQDKIITIATEQEKFRKSIGQLVHDMSSPIEIIKYFVDLDVGDINESKRYNARIALKRLSLLTHNLINKYKDKDFDVNKKCIILIVPIIKQIIAEKELENQNEQINIELFIEDDCYFKSIDINPAMFAGMISNLLNNAIDATQDKSERRITLKLRTSSEYIILFIEDNGSGMPKDVQEMFKQGKSITIGKESGNGIGLTQIYDTIKSVQGDFTIYAKDSVMTEIVIRMPIAKKPMWLAEEICIHHDSIILILDDDMSIHDIWKKKLNSILEENKALQVKYFYSVKDITKFINTITPGETEKIILLTDYEIIKSQENGIDVIRKTMIKNAIVITNYADEIELQEAVIQLDVKLIPKYLLLYVPIMLKFKTIPQSKIVDAVWLEDQVFYANTIIEELFPEYKIDLYNDPADFLNNITIYPHNTKIIIDMYYEVGNGKLYHKNGIDIIRSLNELGYNNLILLTTEYPDLDLPKVTVVLKSDKAGIKMIFKERIEANNSNNA